MSITGSVGRGGVNRVADAIYVQGLINEIRICSGQPPIAVDGIVGPQTIGAIVRIQTGVRDGRVDPGGPTLKRLEGDGNDHDVRLRPTARAIIAICEQVEAIVRQNNLSLDRYGRSLLMELQSVARQLRPYVPGNGPDGKSASYAFVGFRAPNVHGFIQAAASPVTAILFLLAAMIAILAVRAAQPHLGRGGASFARELDARLALLRSKLQEAIAQLIFFVTGVKAQIDKCFNNHGSANNNAGCAQAIAKALKALADFNEEFARLRAFMSPWASTTVVTLEAARIAHARAKVLTELFIKFSAACFEVADKCRCRITFGGDVVVL